MKKAPTTSSNVGENSYKRSKPAERGHLRRKSEYEGHRGLRVRKKESGPTGGLRLAQSRRGKTRRGLIAIPVFPEGGVPNRPITAKAALS